MEQLVKSLAHVDSTVGNRRKANCPNSEHGQIAGAFNSG